MVSFLMNRKLQPFIEYAAEATAACLVTMVQGNILAITAGHLIIASQTGVLAGAIAAAGLFISSSKSRWIVSLALGAATAVVDFYVHPGMFGSVATEAMVTGLAAAILSYLVGSAINYVRASRILSS
jgi:hypothetical protein